MEEMFNSCWPKSQSHRRSKRIILANLVSFNLTIWKSFICESSLSAITNCIFDHRSHDRSTRRQGVCLDSDRLAKMSNVGNDIMVACFHQMVTMQQFRSDFSIIDNAATKQIQHGFLKMGRTPLTAIHNR